MSDCTWHTEQDITFRGVFYSYEAGLVIIFHVLSAFYSWKIHRLRKCAVEGKQRYAGAGGKTWTERVQRRFYVLIEARSMQRDKRK